MLQWNTGDWKHRAYWGENRIGFGADGTEQRKHVGPLPKSGISSSTPSRFDDSCAISPGAVQRAAFHTSHGGCFPVLTAFTKSLTRK